MNIKPALLALICVLSITMSPPTRAEDWPQWRGPERNGLAAPGGLPLAAWPQSGPVKVWQADYDYILRGLGSIAIAGGNVFVYGNLRQNEPVESRTLSERALRELGWLPRITLREGIEQTYRWFLENVAGAARTQ